MAQTNFTPILTYKSDTATSVPSAGNLTNSANGAELAVNTADKRLFTKDSGGNVVEVGTNPSSLTLPNSTANGVFYSNGSKVVTSGSALTFDGTALSLAGALNSNVQNLAGAGTGFTLRVKANDGSVPNASAYRLYLDYLTGAATNGFIDFYRGGGGGDGYLAFGASGSEQMRLTSTGLGIGTSSPAYKLDVNGNAQIGNATAGTNRFLYINGVANKASGIAFQESGTSRWLIGNGAASENGNFEIYDATSGNNFILTRSGNLGLGVTPSAWGGVYRAIQVGTTAVFAGSTSVNRNYSSSNVFWNGSSYRYITTSQATQFEQSDGAYYWLQAPSGTAGNAITFTQAMTLDASGRFIVGATAVSGSNQVEIQTGLTNALWVQTGSTSSSNYVADFRTGSNASVLALRADNTALVSGNLGVGTTSPTYPLTVQANSSTQGIRLIGRASDNIANMSFVANNGSTEYAFINTGATYLAFGVNSAERCRIDSSGNFGIGTTSPAYKVDVNVSTAATIVDLLRLNNGGGSNGGGAALVFEDAGARAKVAGVVFGANENAGLGLGFYTSTSSNGNVIEAARIESGNLLVGTTSALYGARFTSQTSGFSASGLITDTASEYGAVVWNSATAGNNGFFLFGTEGSFTTRGSITYNRSGGLVAYNVTSDYRAKTVNGAVQNALSKVALLKPSTGRMNGATDDIDFFVAHELQEVVPSAVTGEKDAVNEDDTPKYQMVDKSALIPLLTAAIQEQQAIIESLKARLDAANL